jgi:hypothetical protein
MLSRLVQCMPRVRGDIKRCRDMIAAQPGGQVWDCELEIQRGIDEVRADPESCGPEVRLPDSPWCLRRRQAGQFVIVYAFLPTWDRRVPSVVIIRAIKHGCVPDVFDGKHEPSTIGASEDPQAECCILDPQDDMDWDEIIATTEADDRAGRYAFDSANYATDEESMTALRAWIHSIAEEVGRRAAANPTYDAASWKRY